MKRGVAPPDVVAIVWSFVAGFFAAKFLGPGGDATDLAVSFGWFMMGPLAWFVGRR
jgi:hypothetical protein